MKLPVLIFALFALLGTAGCGQAPYAPKKSEEQLATSTNTTVQATTTAAVSDGGSTTTTLEKIIETLTPPSYAVLKSAYGDLNKDGLTDVATIYSSTQEEVPSITTDSGLIPDRELHIYFQTKAGNLYEAASSTSAIMCNTCGGLLGEPLYDLAITNGVLVIDHYGGDRDRWGFTNKFRWQNGNFYLIGRIVLTADNALLVSEKKEYNLITGEYKIASYVPDGYKDEPGLSAEDKAAIAEFDTGEKRGKIKTKPLITLQDFDIYNEFTL